VNGDPTNDNINGTFFEHDTDSTQLRHGGDLQGLVDTLDYLHGMGIKVRTGAIAQQPNFTANHPRRDSTSPDRHSSISLGATTSTLRSI